MDGGQSKQSCPHRTGIGSRCLWNFVDWLFHEIYIYIYSPVLWFHHPNGLKQLPFFCFPGVLECSGWPGSARGRCLIVWTDLGWVGQSQYMGSKTLSREAQSSLVYQRFLCVNTAIHVCIYIYIFFGYPKGSPIYNSQNLATHICLTAIL